MPPRSPYARLPSPPTRLPFVVRTLGRMRRDPYHSTLGTYHDDAMLTVMLSGAGRYVRGGRSVSVRGGMVGLVLPGDDVGLFMAEPSDPYDHLYCRFAGDEAMRIARRVVAAHAGADHCSDAAMAAFFAHPAWEEIARVLTHALGRGEVSPTSQPIERMRRVDALLAEALTLLEQPPVDEAAPRPTADRLLAYLNDHLASPTDLEAMAAHFGVSKSHLCRVAKRELGQTLQRVWEQVKLERARVLLAEPSLNVSEVARRVGYADVCYFSNVFKRGVGVRPTAFRAGLRPS